LGFFSQNKLNSNLLLLCAQAKIADFGATVPAGQKMAYEFQSPRWAAPELLLRTHPCTTSSDVYSLGLLMWEVSHRQIAFDMREDHIQYHVVVDGGRPKVCSDPIAFLKKEEIRPPPLQQGQPISEEVSIAHFDGLCEACWATDPSTRPTARQVLEKLKWIAHRVNFRLFHGSFLILCSDHRVFFFYSSQVLKKKRKRKRKQRKKKE
jgi:serine/threonine protein kinase